MEEIKDRKATERERDEGSEEGSENDKVKGLRESKMGSLIKGGRDRDNKEIKKERNGQDAEGCCSEYHLKK